MAGLTTSKKWEISYVSSPHDSRMGINDVFLPSILIDRVVDSHLSLIDMPMALVSEQAITALGDQGPAIVNQREDAVRRLLRERVQNGGRLVSSVFNVPILEAVYAQDYESAVRIHKEASGKSISKQTWNIVYRIKQARAILSTVPSMKYTLLESHPETLFRFLNETCGGEAMLSKRTQDGIDQRVGLLEKAVEGSSGAFEEVWQNWGKDERVQKDDILDAMVLALCALGAIETGHLTTPTIVDGKLHDLEIPLQDFCASKLGGMHSRRRDVFQAAQFPEDFPFDDKGIPLAMVFAELPYCSL